MLLSFQLEVVHMEQSNADFYILHELIKDYLSLLGVVKVQCMAPFLKHEKEHFVYAFLPLPFTWNR